MLCRLLYVIILIGLIGEWPLERDPMLYSGLWRSPLVFFGPLFVSVPGVNLFPWQLLLLGAVPLCLLQPNVIRNRAWSLDATVAISLATVAITFLWGWLRGASAYQAYYQLWRFLAALVVCFLLNCVMRRPSDLRALGLTVLGAALTRGGLGIYFYWAYVRGMKDPPAYLTTHDDTLLFVAGLLVSVTWAIVRGTKRAWVSAVVMTSILLYAIVLNNRRLAWIELVLAFALLYFLLPTGTRRRVTRWGLVAAPFVMAYVAIGWGRDGALFAPIKALSSAGSHEDASSLARQEEIRNLLYTLTAIGNPLLGTGWGVGYKEATSVYTHFGGVGFWQYPFLQHNSLLGVAVFSGVVGLFGIWLVVPVTAMLAMRGYQSATRPIERAASLTIMCLLPAYGIQCYGDIGLQSLTCSLLLGVAMASAGKISVWANVSARRHRRLLQAA